ncbi:MAG: site-2 protease family protein [Candidatus Saccharibacteria bacterium]
MDINTLVYIGIVIIVILISMTLHEAMHAYAGYWLGDDTAKLQGRLTLNPIKHIDPFMTLLLPLMLALVGAPIFGGAKPVPFNPRNVRWGEWGAALIALAGPLTNFLIAFIFFGIWVLTGTSGPDLLSQIFSIIVSVNLGFFVFNLIPIPPLDGSRVMYALAPDFVRKGMEVMERYGIVVVFAIILVGGNYIGVFMSSSISFFFDVFNNIFIH